MLGRNQPLAGEWWGSHGLLPPAAWNVTGAHDMVPASGQPLSINKQKAGELLDGNIHNCTPWLPSTLDAIRTLLCTPSL